MSERNRSLVVEMARYEGDDFPEAEHYAEFCASKLAQIFPRYAVEVRYAGYRTHAWAEGANDVADNTDEEVAREAERLCKAEFWEEFSADGYKAYATG